jgi:hypothetical protein
MVISLKTYLPHPRYLLLAVVCGLFAGLFVWTLWQSFTPATLFFCALCLGLTLWNGQAALTQVQLDGQKLTVSAPLRSPRTIELRQLASVSEEGRLTRVLTITYYPVQPNGLLDMEQLDTVHLPTLDDQAELLAQLQAKAPA